MKHSSKKWLVLVASIALVVIILIVTRSTAPSPEPAITPDTAREGASSVLPPLAEQFSTDFSKHSVDYSLLLSGGPDKDGIPALSNPEFTTLDDASFDDEVLGILVSIGDEKRFYPYSILVWHEIVNDTIDDTHFAVTFCPLCGSAIVFDRNINGTIVEFGVSGMLFESNMVMYDRVTESLWSQARGESIAGDYTGTRLDLVSMQLLSFEELQQKHPDAKVLSKKTGYFRNYNFYPYGDYDESGELFFPVSIHDTRLPLKELLVVVPTETTSIAIPLNDIAVNSVTSHSLETGENILIKETSGEIEIAVNSTPSPYYIEMWFSWAQHHQDDGVVVRLDSNE